MSTRRTSSRLEKTSDSIEQPSKKSRGNNNNNKKNKEKMQDGNDNDVGDDQLVTLRNLPQGLCEMITTFSRSNLKKVDTKASSWLPYVFRSLSEDVCESIVNPPSLKTSPTTTTTNGSEVAQMTLFAERCLAGVETAHCTHRGVEFSLTREKRIFNELGMDVDFVVVSRREEAKESKIELMGPC